ncbi:MAG: metal-dependent hydrolase [Ghiorsea sp.]|nr:metal-dependent hydrolase [Ghiorsea sp.]
MLGTSHRIMGFASGAGLASFFGADVVGILTCSFVGSLGALAPDIDHRGSKVGRMFGPLSWLVSSLFKHRGFTHSLLMLLILAWTVDRYLSPHEMLGYAFIAGVASHILGDMLTKKKVMFLWPVPIYIGFPIMRTGSKMEMPIAVILSLLMVMAPYHEDVLSFYYHYAAPMWS